MKVELFPFQKKALASLRNNVAVAMGSYHQTRTPQVVSFTAPTGSGKTIIMASLIESIFFGDDYHPDEPDAIFVWLSDSPQLNEQSKLKIDGLADGIRLGQCITIEDESFDDEVLEDGTIYFLNTQKLSKSANLTKKGDSRTYTIWETLANTAREKSNRLYVIIDEAHRGMQGREASKATSIMQKFLKGSDEDKLPPMPVVVGMSATTERFNKLVEGTTSTIHKSVVTAEEVRASGLLKDRIVITYPDEKSINKDMAVLQAAAADWKDKWEHWEQYCREQHYAYVNPVLVVQVQNGTGDALSDTDLDDALAKIEESAGVRFETGQVTHCFGQPQAEILINGLAVPYVEASRISDDKNIRVVFFKESLSTGWDCPRAETMMSFRHAKDATYIAQLLGRMVRTPMQMHIQVDETLNDVHLFLPHFDEATVADVVKALQDSEGGEIPTDIYGEAIGDAKMDTLTVRPSGKRSARQIFGQSSIWDGLEVSEQTSGKASAGTESPIVEGAVPTASVMPEPQATPVVPSGGNAGDIDCQAGDASSVSGSSVGNASGASTSSTPPSTEYSFVNAPKGSGAVGGDLFDREEVMRFINEAGLLSYDVRSIKISNYLASLFKMAHLLTQAGLYPAAVKDTLASCVAMIREHTDGAKASGAFEELASRVRQFKLETQIFDVFGESVKNYQVQDFYATTDSDIDRQFRLAEAKLGNEGIGNAYGSMYADAANPTDFKVDVIVFAADDGCLEKLHSFAKGRFHELNDEYRKYIAKINSDKIRRQYDSIVSDGDIVSKHNFRLPETIQVPHDAQGRDYRTHLFVSEETGVVRIRLNKWEEDVIAEEEQRDDFVCWIRNPSRGSWALCIPYKIDAVDKPAYPDFLVVRRDDKLGYIIDILEPHDPTRVDNLGKAQGFAEYARQNPGIGRIQLIRKEKDVAGIPKFKRLDMSMTAVRDKVTRATSNEELDHIFETDGFFGQKK
ncbi:MAG: DEAD/DEAH box helicase family protein [Eggerthellaceae bacterium]|nr:DEAD/DEAH box helicase family protein [Eggerthellaceae bacterium]